MLEDFIHEGLLVNNVLNLINDKEFDQARMAWISALLESGNVGRHNLIRDGTTDDGSQQWDCWGCISSWHCILKMTKFVEKDSIGFCDKCNRDGEQAVNVTSSSTTSIPKEKEVDIGDACIPLEYKPPPNTKKRKTRHGHGHLHFPQILMSNLQSELDNRYSSNVGDNIRNQVHCMLSNEGCPGRCALTTTMEEFPIMLVIEPSNPPTLDCPTVLHSMDDIELSLFIAGTRYNLAFVILHNSSHFRGIAVFHDDKYVLYDGMLPTMELIDRNKRFSEGGNYRVASLWYRKAKKNQLHTMVSILVEDELSKIVGKKKQSTLKYEPVNVKIKVEDSKNSVTSTDQQKTSSNTPTFKSTTTEFSSRGPSTHNKSTIESKLTGHRKTATQAKQRTPSKRARTPKHKFSPPEDKKHATSRPKRKPYPIGLSVAQGSAMGPQPTCKYCRTCIMRSQWRAIKKVKRNGNGLGNDISQYHLKCVKKVLSKKELEQLLAIIRSLDLDPDVGSRSAMIRQIDDGDSKKTAWDYIFEND